MKTRVMALAAGVSCLSFILLASSRGAAQGDDTAAQPRFLNARVEQRPAGSSLESAFAAAVRGHSSPAWIAYSVRSAPGEHGLCDADAPRRMYLEGRPHREAGAEHAVPASAIVILFRAEGGKVQRLRVASMGCELDAGGLPVTWLTGVAAPDSIRLLQGFVKGNRPGVDVEAVRVESALMAIALHGDASASRALQEFAAPGQPTVVRRRAVFWLGTARGEVDTLIRFARTDGSLEIRKEAMFWLARSKDARAQRFVDEVLRQ